MDWLIWTTIDTDTPFSTDRSGIGNNRKWFVPKHASSEDSPNEGKRKTICHDAEPSVYETFLHCAAGNTRLGPFGTVTEHIEYHGHSLQYKQNKQPERYR